MTCVMVEQTVADGRDDLSRTVHSGDCGRDFLPRKRFLGGPFHLLFSTPTVAMPDVCGALDGRGDERRRQQRGRRARSAVGRGWTDRRGPAVPGRRGRPHRDSREPRLADTGTSAQHRLPDLTAPAYTEDSAGRRAGVSCPGHPGGGARSRGESGADGRCGDQIHRGPDAIGGTHPLPTARASRSGWEPGPARQGGGHRHLPPSTDPPGFSGSCLTTDMASGPHRGRATDRHDGSWPGRQAGPNRSARVTASVQPSYAAPRTYLADGQPRRSRAGMMSTTRSWRTHVGSVSSAAPSGRVGTHRIAV